MWFYIIFLLFLFFPRKCYIFSKIKFAQTKNNKVNENKGTVEWQVH